MGIIKTGYFKSTLTKGQIEALAIDESKKMLERDDALANHVLLKKVSLYLKHLMAANQKNALMTWEIHKHDYPNISHYSGKKTYDFKHIEVYNEFEGYLKDITDAAKKAIESKTPVMYVHPFTGEVITMDKATFKESHETLNVKL